MTLPSRDALYRSFLCPPATARPHLWWHWLNGNVSHEGIRLDLEWMQRIGIGGVQKFEATWQTPTVVTAPVAFLSTEWKEAFRYAVTLADQLGLEVSVAGSPGWSESGGPWVAPEHAMKKLVWSETVLDDGGSIDGPLAQPPCVVGPFQNAPVNWAPPFFAPPLCPVPEIYRDIAVLAYRLPEIEAAMAELDPTVITSAGTIDAQILWDGDFTSAVTVPVAGKGESAWIKLDFRQPRTFQSLSLALQHGRPAPLSDPTLPVAEIQVSEDDIHYRTVVIVYDSADTQRTATFELTRGRYFRLLLLDPPVSAGAAAIGFPPEREHRVAQFVLHSAPRAHLFEQKAGFFSWVSEVHRLDRLPTPCVATRDVIDPRYIRDLTSQMSPDGTLRWTPPTSGRWAILRLGYSLLGSVNVPAPADARGLEVDKLSSDAVREHMRAYLGHCEAALGRELMGKRGLRGMVNDSWEAGAQNWTDCLPTEFAKRRGYDIQPWLPALTGRVVASAESTDRFLWDFRRTLGDLVADNHYGEIANALHERGMTHANETHEHGRAFVGDGMDAKRHSDIPMGAMWVGNLRRQEIYDADLRESASVAHIYGQQLVAAESMTAFGIPPESYAYMFFPESLKSTADRELAHGINRFVIHTSVHQPLTKPGPGITLGPVGQWFSRNETWAEHAAPWITYLARSSYLLQQGHFVADVVYYYGQDSNITALYSHGLPPIPEGYAFDFGSAHALAQLSVRGERLATKSGTSYRLLAIDPRVSLMSLDVLQTIEGLVRAGATLVGSRPLATPSLADDPVEFQQICALLWKSDEPGMRPHGAGTVISGRSLSDAVADLNLIKDFDYSGRHADTEIWYLHRHLEDRDIYFITNRRARAEHIEARFRVTGLVPELWRADTGTIESLSYHQMPDYVLVTLHLDAHDAVFVIFRELASQQEATAPTVERRVVGTISGHWNVRFQPDRGAPDSERFSELTSWSSHPDPRIRYFSGTACYDTDVEIPAEWLQQRRRLEIDLGSVKNLAELVINDQPVEILWKAPFRTDVTDFLRPGINSLEIRVTNLWRNRLIGDRQPDTEPVAFTTFNPYDPDSPLLDSGLLGPVVFLSVSRPS